MEHKLFKSNEIKMYCSEPESSEENTVDLLAEARHTSYVKGRWVYAGNGSEMQYRIVHPTLPGHGDYSAYLIWCKFEHIALNSSQEL